MFNFKKLKNYEKIKMERLYKRCCDIMGGIMVGASIDQSNYILMGIGGAFITISLYYEHFKDTVNE